MEKKTLLTNLIAYYATHLSFIENELKGESFATIHSYIREHHLSFGICYCAGHVFRVKDIEWASEGYTKEFSLFWCHIPEFRDTTEEIIETMNTRLEIMRTILANTI